MLHRRQSFATSENSHNAVAAFTGGGQRRSLAATRAYLEEVDTVERTEAQLQEDKEHYETIIRGAVRAYLVLGGQIQDVHRFVYEEVDTLDW